MPPCHLLQCLLISLLYYLPGVLLSRTYVSMSDPSASRCSLDDLVSRLTLEDLARLVSRWSHREGHSPVKVLHLLENGISTSQQVHASMPAAEMSETGQSAAEEEFRHFMMMSKNRGPPSQQQPGSPLLPSNNGNLPSVLSTHRVSSSSSSSSIGSNGLPPPSPSGGMRAPANFPLLPPPPPPFGQASHSSPFLAAPGARQQMPPMIPFETLRPPPDAIVRIEDNVFGSSFPEVPVTVSPRMPITEALIQAAVKYDVENSPDGGLAFNRYKIIWGHNSQSRCLIVLNVGNLGSNDGPIWEVIVEDRTGQEIWRSVCLPSLAEVNVRPGMTITLNYIKQEDL